MDPLPRSILLISDCISALKACFCGKVTDRFNRVIMSIKEVVCFLEDKDTVVKATWIPGHMGFDLNEEADSLAKEAAARATETSLAEDRFILSKILKHKIYENWQFRIKHSEKVSVRTLEINDQAGSWYKYAGDHPLLAYLFTKSVLHWSSLFECFQSVDCPQYRHSGRDFDRFFHSFLKI